MLRRLLCCAVAALAFAAPAAAHTDHPVQLQFEWPAQGTITTPFGNTGGRWHPGIDIGILRSLTVRAAANGTVRLTGEPTGYEGYGKIVEIGVRGGYTTIYAHLAAIGVRPRQHVTAGQRIGIAGCTGWCTGTRLHFEVRRGGVPIDPLSIPFG